MQIEALDVAHLKLLGPVGQGDVRGFFPKSTTAGPWQRRQNWALGWRE